MQGQAREGQEGEEDSRIPNEPLDEKFTCSWENSMQLKVFSLGSCSEVFLKVFIIIIFLIFGGCWNKGREMYIIIKTKQNKTMVATQIVYFVALCKGKTILRG